MINLFLKIFSQNQGAHFWKKCIFMHRDSMESKNASGFISSTLILDIFRDQKSRVVEDNKTNFET